MNVLLADAALVEIVTTLSVHTNALVQMEEPSVMMERNALVSVQLLKYIPLLDSPGTRTIFNIAVLLYIKFEQLYFLYRLYSYTILQREIDI